MQYIVTTSHGALAVEDVGQGNLPLVLSNSTCRDVFRHQLTGSLAADRRLIAFDLPGHGQSSDAPDPARTYTRPGLADAVVELLEKLGVKEAVVLGWSLGGHIGIEMAPRFAGMRGLMVIGTPPVARNGMADGFQRSPHMQLAGQEHLSETDIEAFVHAIFGKSAEPFLQKAVARADGRFRKTLFEAARAGSGVDQRQIVETNPVPLAVVNGSEDRFVKLDYLDTLAYANLWEGRCHRLAGLGHAPFWEGPGDFDPILERFFRDVESGRARAPREL
jgi:pimeloyl-ACP methyl ester carboxylesterase